VVLDGSLAHNLWDCSPNNRTILSKEEYVALPIAALLAGAKGFEVDMVTEN